MNVVVAPDSFGGLLSASEAAAAIAEGWQSVRPDDEIVARPMSDGGEGLLDAVAARSGGGADHVVVETEVCGPLGLPVDARFLLDGTTAIIESAEACGLKRITAEQRDPLRATTYGVGELLDAARDAGATRILVGLGGSASVDGGAGALTGLGFRLRVADGSGLKIGGRDLHRVRRAERGWASDWEQVEVICLADVTTVLADAAHLFGPQKGADSAAVELLAEGLRAWREVADQDLQAGELAERPGSGAAGGLGFGLAAGIGARLESGASTVAGLIDLGEALEGADLVITGEGRLDGTSFSGKVVGTVVDRAVAAGVPAAAIVGVDDGITGTDFAFLETAPADDADAAVAAIVAAAARSARGWAD